MESRGVPLLLGKNRSDPRSGSIYVDDERPRGVRMYEDWSLSKSFFQSFEGLVGCWSPGQRLGLVVGW